MASTSPMPPSYWLLSGETPTGPFDAQDLRAKLATGEIDRTARVCVVGSKDWVTLSEAGMANSGAMPTPDTGQASTTPPSSTAAPDTNMVDTLLGFVMIGAAVVGLIWFISWLLSPLTPRQVAEKLHRADTYQSAEPWITLNLRPAIKSLEAHLNGSSDPNDKDELTVDMAAPPEIGGHLVGFRLQYRDTATKQLEQLDGYYHLIESDGWKVNDMLVTTYNHQPLEQPLSIARDYRLLLGGLGQTPPKAAGAGTSKNWLDPKHSGPLGYGIGRLVSTNGKGIAAAFIAAAAALGALVRKRSTTAAQGGK